MKRDGTEPLRARANPVHGRLGAEQRVAGHAAPRGDVFGRTGVGGDQLQRRAGHGAQAMTEGDDEFTAAEVAGVPGGVFGGGRHGDVVSCSARIAPTGAAEAVGKVGRDGVLRGWEKQE